MASMIDAAFFPDLNTPLYEVQSGEAQCIWYTGLEQLISTFIDTYMCIAEGH